MTFPPDRTQPAIYQLRELMRILRDKDHGCPWDIKQDFASIARYTIEEAYEVVDAIEKHDMPELRGELGDLLLQVMFHSQMAEEMGHFTFEDVAQEIVDKMVSRHPHVFGDADARTAQSQSDAWEAQKQQERTQAGHESLMDNVPRALPSLIRSHKLQKRAATVGFDWDHPRDVMVKICEELAEVTEAIEADDRQNLKEEIGDLLFVITNLARKYGFHAEECADAANRKFESRFRNMEQTALKEHSSLKDESLDILEQRWNAAKQAEHDVS